MVLKRLKLPKFFNGVARTFPTHKHGCRKRGRNLEISAKNAVFLISSAKKQISPLLAPVQKLLEKSTTGLPGKIPFDAHAHKHVKWHHFCEKLCCITPSVNTAQQHQRGKQPIAGWQAVSNACRPIMGEESTEFLKKNLLGLCQTSTLAARFGELCAQL